MANTIINSIRKIAKGLRILTRNAATLGSFFLIKIPIISGTTSDTAKVAIFEFGIRKWASSEMRRPKYKIHKGIITATTK